MTYELFQRYISWGFPQKETTIPTAIRINTLKAKTGDVLADLEQNGVEVDATPIAGAYVVDAPFSIASTFSYLQGKIHIQELVSQLPPLVANITPEMKVLDIAAAPGGKATHAAALMNNTGTIVAIDPVHERLEQMYSVSSRLGVKNIVAYQMDGCYADDLVSDADVVLCDVPCSGNYCQPGWSPTLKDVQGRVELQKKLLESAVYSCKENGTIVYSTCSLEKEENEDVIEWALQELPVELEETQLNFGRPGLTEQTTLCKRFWPTQDGTGGFFIAKLKRKE